MDDGVTLIDKDMRLQLMSRQQIEARGLPPELATAEASSPLTGFLEQANRP